MLSTDRLSFAGFQKGMMIALILTGHFLQFYVYKGSEAYWQDPVFKTLYIFIFAYYMGVNGYLVSSKLQAQSLAEVVRFKFLQFMLPLCFWLAVELAFIVLYPPARPGGQLSAGGLLGLLAGFWILFSDVVSILLLRLVGELKINLKIAVPLSMLLVFLIPNGEKLSLLALIRYGYLATATGYMIGVFRLDVRLPWPVFALMLPACCVIYAFWTTDTFIYENRLNYLDPYKRQRIGLMLLGMIVFSIAAYPLLRWIWLGLSRTPTLLAPFRALATLNSPVIMFEVVFFYVISNTDVWRSGVYAIDLAVGAAMTIAAVCLIRLSMTVIRPGTWLFHLVWGTLANLGDPPRLRTPQVATNPA